MLLTLASARVLERRSVSCKQDRTFGLQRVELGTGTQNRRDDLCVIRKAFGMIPTKKTYHSV